MQRMGRASRKAILGAAAGLVLAALVAPGAASAASPPLQVSGAQIIYGADAGETNDLVISRDGANYVFTDPGGFDLAADVHASCSWVGAGEATCPAGGINRFTISLDDMDDTLAIDPTVGPPIQSTNLSGGAGNDTISAPPDSLFDNQFNGQAGNDTLLGGAFEDSFLGGDGNDVMIGGPGDDRFLTSLGDDVMEGGPGSDDFEQGSAPDGADAISGGPDFDEVDYGQRSGDVAVTLDGVANDGEAGEGDNVDVDVDVEDVRTGAGNDTIVGDSGPNSINAGDGSDDARGGEGNDSVFAFGGTNVLRGEGGNDSIGGGSGADTLEGGPGDDYLFESFSDQEADVISGGPGLDSLGGGSQSPINVSLDGVANDGLIDPPEPTALDNVGADVENVAGTNFDDILTGNDSPNELTGNGGDDTLIGMSGADGMFGGGGADMLDGGAGIDVLEGGAGADTLRSRDGGADELDCGSSVDGVFADGFDVLAVDCDLVSRGVVIAAKKVKVSGTGKKGKKSKSAKQAALPKKARAQLRASCPAIEPGGCEATFKLRSAKKLKVPGKKGRKAKRKKITIAKGTRTIGAGEKLKVGLKLTKAARKALSPGDKVNARAIAKMTDSEGAKVKSERKVKVVA